MKKGYKAFIFSLLFMLCIGVTAEAGYVAGDNYYADISSDGAKAVIIYEGDTATSESIYYVNQSDDSDGFSGLRMLMKANAPAGTYTVATDLGSRTFTISNAEAYVSGAKKAEFLGAELKTGSSTYSAAFGIRASALLTSATTLAMVIGNTAYSTYLTGANSIIDWTSGNTYIQDGYIMFALQIDGIGSDYITDNDGVLTPNFSLYVK